MRHKTNHPAILHDESTREARSLDRRRDAPISGVPWQELGRVSQYRSYPGVIVKRFVGQVYDGKDEEQVRNRIKYLLRRYGVIYNEFSQSGSGVIGNEPSIRALITSKLSCFYEIHEFMHDRVNVKAPYTKDVGAEALDASTSNVALAATKPKSPPKPHPKRGPTDPFLESLMEVTRRGVDLQQKQLALQQQALDLEIEKMRMEMERSAHRRQKTHSPDEESKAANE